MCVCVCWGGVQATPGLEQYAYKKYAEAFEVIPTVLAENAGYDVRLCADGPPHMHALTHVGTAWQGTDIVSKLYAAHQAGNATVGVDVNNDATRVCDVRPLGLLDSLLAKHWAIRYATDAAVTVLRVDQLIMSKASGGPKPKANPNWDEDPDPAQAQ
jgi:T-complex protein 1 subunit theta